MIITLIELYELGIWIKVTNFLFLFITLIELNEPGIFIPSTCIRGRDIVIASLVCVCVCVCLSVCVSPLNS